MEENSPIRPHSTERLLIAFAIALFLLLGAAQMLAPAPPPEPSGDSIRPELVIQARYVLGVGALLESLGQDGDQVDALLDSLVTSTTGPAERLRLAPLALALDKVELAEKLVEETRDAEGVEDLRQLALALLPPAAENHNGDWEEIEARHGFFGELAVALATGRGDTARSQAIRVATLLIVAVFAALLFLVTGFVFAFIAFSKFRSGRLHSGYLRETRNDPSGSAAPSSQDSGLGYAAVPLDEDLAAASTIRRVHDRVPYLEAVLVVIVGLQVVGLFIAVAMAGADIPTPPGDMPGEATDSPSGSRWPLLLNWLVLPLLLWPLRRGAERGAFLSAIGWTRGQGILREMACGLVGYVTAAPLLLLGFLASAFLAQSTGQTPHHPILDWVQQAGVLELALVVSVATLWAPIVEESLFRGVFFHYLRGRWGLAASAFTISVAFAALHPQGLAGLPFLISLAMTLAFVREWRGSLIAPITVHMIHNGLIMGLLLSLL